MPEVHNSTSSIIKGVYFWQTFVSFSRDSVYIDWVSIILVGVDKARVGCIELRELKSFFLIQFTSISDHTLYKLR